MSRQNRYEYIRYRMPKFDLELLGIYIMSGFYTSSLTLYKVILKSWDKQNNIIIKKKKHCLFTTSSINAFFKTIFKINAQNCYRLLNCVGGMIGKHRVFHAWVHRHRIIEWLVLHWSQLESHKRRLFNASIWKSRNSIDLGIMVANCFNISDKITR